MEHFSLLNCPGVPGDAGSLCEQHSILWPSMATPLPPFPSPFCTSAKLGLRLRQACTYAKGGGEGGKGCMRRIDLISSMLRGRALWKNNPQGRASCPFK